MNADTDPNLMIPRAAYRELRDKFNALYEEVGDLRAAGDLMQSSLSRLIAHITTDTLPYEVRMALHEGGDGVRAWTDARAESQVNAFKDKEQNGA